MNEAGEGGQEERRAEFLATLAEIEIDRNFPDSLAVKSVSLPEEDKEKMRDYYRKKLERAQAELESLSERDDELSAEERSGGSNQYIKEKYRRIIRIYLYDELIENGSIDFVDAYNEMKNNPDFADNADEFIHQFGTCLTGISHEIGLAERGHLHELLGSQI